MLAAIEKHAGRYGMRLNSGKCVYINMGNKNKIKFQNGEELKKVEEADYLGAKITKKNLNRREVEERISKALEVCKKIEDFPQENKMQIRMEVTGIQRSDSFEANLWARNDVSKRVPDKTARCIPNERNKTYPRNRACLLVTDQQRRNT